MIAAVKKSDYRKVVIENVLKSWEQICEKLVEKSFQITGIVQCPYGGDKHNLYKPLFELVYSQKSANINGNEEKALEDENDDKEEIEYDADYNDEFEDFNLNFS